MGMRDEPPNEARVAPQRLAQSNDLLHKAGGLRDRHHDRPVAAFDPLRQRHFFLAREERHPAHVREIQSHDVAGRVGSARCQVGLVRVRARVVGPLALERRRVDVVAGIPTPAKQAVHLTRRAVRGQEGIDLLAEEVALLLPEGDQLADRVVLLASRHR